MFYITLFCLTILILSFFYVMVTAIGKYILKDNIDDFNLKMSISASFILLFSLLIYGVVVINDRIVNAVTKNGVIDYSGTLGDLIGGILNPVLALFGILAGGLAFYAQYRANQQVQEQFRVQQFESQFYEMLHLHRENLNEMVIEGYEYDYSEDDKTKVGIQDSKRAKITSGKKIFVTMLNEFEAIHLICKKVFFSYYKADPIKLEKLKKHIGTQVIFDHSYYIFFNGIKFYSKNIGKYVADDKTDLLNVTLLKRYTKELERLKKEHQQGIKVFKKYTLVRGLNEKLSVSNILWLSFNYKPFSGHQSILAHYYRHLFQTVKFVSQQPESVISYKSKRDYLRILRSMLSNHEQILLYYNWIGGFGNDWEKKKNTGSVNYRFFTDYRMIHNIPNQMVIDEFKLDKVFIDDFLNFRYEQGKRETDTLFELLPIKSKC